ncbi:MAG: Cell division and transport-associated protein TolA [Proteobacteria bacterium]|nr:Cell division and transport-associated protein TolA [Pseudomonadota bacterium]
MILAAPQPEAGRWQAIAFSVLVHGFLLAFLFFGVQWKRNVPDVVVAELWSSRPSPAVIPAAAPAPEIKPESRPEPKIEPKPEPKSEPAPVPVEKPQIAVAKEKKPPKPIKQEQLLPRPKPEKSEPATRPSPKSWDVQLRSEVASLGVDREKAQLAASAANQRALASWMDRVGGKIRGNTVRPANLQGNPVAVFSVSLLPSGEVLSVKLKRSSGVRAWDEASERAILKSSPLPKSDDGAVFNRDLELLLCPDEQGCR